LQLLVVSGCHEGFGGILFVLRNLIFKCESSSDPFIGRCGCSCRHQRCLFLMVEETKAASHIGRS
jgi:hypothetical protein